MALLLAWPLLAPLVAAAVAALAGWRRAVGWTAVAAAGFVLAAGILTGTLAVAGAAFSGWVFRIDALSSVMLIVLGAVGLVATWANVSYLEGERAAGHTTARQARIYSVLIPLFLAAMVAAVLSNNLGVLWAAIEATTIVTAFLVGHRRSAAALEATWKYVMICSVGIALALLGTVLVYYAARQAGIPASQALDWTQLLAHARQLDPGVMRVGFALLVLGYGTKAGLVPMHSWLPDAHSQAPAPVSALMSGVLLSVAVYALLRYRIIAVAVLDPSFVRTLLVAVALASLVLAASLLLVQHDYKRMLAYHSIEHMGLVVLGAAVGTPLAVAALLLHILGHGLAKAVLFCGSGQILAVEGTSRITSVQGLLARRPVLAGTFALGLAALLGLPPFSLFASELGMARAAAAAGMGWAVAITFVLLLVVFVAVTAHATPMLLGTRPTQGHPAHPDPVRTQVLTQPPGAADLPVRTVLHAKSDPDPLPPTATGTGTAPGAVGLVTREVQPSQVATAKHAPTDVEPHSRATGVAPLITGLVALAALGTIGWPLGSLLRAAATIAGTP